MIGWLLCTGTAVGAKRNEPSKDEKIIVSLCTCTFISTERRYSLSIKIPNVSFVLCMQLLLFLYNSVPLMITM